MNAATTLPTADASDDINRQQETRDSLLRSVIRHLPLNVFAIDTEGIIIFEDGHQTPLENAFSAHVGKSVYEVHKNEQEFIADTHRVLAGETIERERNYGGAIYETYYAPLRDAEGNIIGAVGMGSDVTERLRMQQSALDTDRLRISLQKEVELSDLKSKIMRRIAHEFRTPLSTIQLSAQILERYFDRLTNDERSKRIQTILQQTQQITRLMEDISMLVQAQGQRSRFNPYQFNLVELCNALIEDVRTSSGAQHYWSFDIAPEVEHVHADARLVAIILQNLFSNAVSFSQTGTVIKVSAAKDVDLLVLQVSDQGIGIVEEEQAQIFDVFFRGSNFDERPGLGVGLSLVRDAVKNHNGSISLESTPGIGTTFTIRLPVGNSIITTRR
jgi:two-component system, OmpR family, sensor histidine kinase VicK